MNFFGSMLGPPTIMPSPPPLDMPPTPPQPPAPAETSSPQSSISSTFSLPTGESSVGHKSALARPIAKKAPQDEELLKEVLKQQQQQTPVKHAQQQEEGHAPRDEDERRASYLGAHRFNTARGGSSSGQLTGSSARYASPKGKASSRFQAMTARDAERDAADRAKELKRRESARLTARKASASRTPLPSSRPPPAAWRKLPNGQSLADMHVAGRASASPQLDELWEKAEDSSYHLGLPPQPQEQLQEPVYGSERQPTAKERRFQADKMEQIAVRKRLIALREQEKERKAIFKYEARQKELQHYRKAAQRPKNELKASQDKAKEIRERLNEKMRQEMEQEREEAWKQRATA